MSKNKATENLDVIRTDIRKIFLRVSLFAVNAGLFSTGGNPRPRIREEGFSGEIFRQMRLLGTDVVFYSCESGQCDFLSTHAAALKRNGHTVLKDREGVSGKLEKVDCVIIGSEESDIDFFPLAAFRTAPISAPLLLKAESDYVSNYDGESAFTEIADLIVNSKKRV